MRIISVVGARPQFVKLAAINNVIQDFALEHLVINTGQHYDYSMSDIFFDDLKIPKENFNLQVGSASHGIQTGSIMSALDPLFEELNPDWVLTYGDTNSTLAAALSAVKMHLKVAHLEAGLRSFNRRMPEEHNRVLVDHASDPLLAPTQIAYSNLKNEGLQNKSVIIGDVMTDICLKVRNQVINEPVVSEVPYLVATIHRSDNTDDPNVLNEIISNIQKLPIKVKLIVHPRLEKHAKQFSINLEQGSISTMQPISYREMIKLIVNSQGVITDSGGLQKETYLLNKPCTTLRTETEWVETLENNWNILDPVGKSLMKNAMREIPKIPIKHYYGDGFAANKSIQEIIKFTS